jgi:hypothetical protein
MQTRKWRVGRQVCRFRSWGGFEKQLGQTLGLWASKEGRYIVIGARVPTRYIQFASIGNGGVKGEATSNYYLKRGERLTVAACRRLMRLGWKGPRKKGNFWNRWRSPVSLGELGSLAVRTLRDVFKMNSPRALEIELGEFPPANVAGTISYYVAAQLAGAFLKKDGAKFILGRTCGHRHNNRDAAETCLAKKPWRKRERAVAMGADGECLEPGPLQKPPSRPKRS